MWSHHRAPIKRLAFWIDCKRPICLCMYVCMFVCNVCVQLSGVSEVSTWLSHIGHSLLTSRQLFTDESVTLVSYTLSVAVSQQCQSVHLSQLLHTVSALTTKYNTVRSTFTSLSICYTLCLKKTTLMLHTITSTHIN